jgi:hypothetical protein
MASALVARPLRVSARSRAVLSDKEHAALQRIADALGVNKAALLEG